MCGRHVINFQPLCSRTHSYRIYAICRETGMCPTAGSIELTIIDSMLDESVHGFCMCVRSTRVQVILIPIKCDARARLVHIVHCSRFVLTLAGPYNGTGNYTPLTTANKISHIFLLLNKIQIKFTYVCVWASAVARSTTMADDFCWFLVAFSPATVQCCYVSLIFPFRFAFTLLRAIGLSVFVCAALSRPLCEVVGFFLFSWRYCCHLFHLRVKIQNGRITITIKSEN